MTQHASESGHQKRTFAESLWEMTPAARRWWLEFRILVPDVAKEMEALICLSYEKYAFFGGRPQDSTAQIARHWIWIPTPPEPQTLLRLALSYALLHEKEFSRAFDHIIPGSPLDPSISLPPVREIRRFPSCDFCWNPNAVDWEGTMDEWDGPDSATCPYCLAPYSACEDCGLYFPWLALHDRIKQATCDHCKRRYEFWWPWRKLVLDSISDLYLNQHPPAGEAPPVA